MPTVDEVFEILGVKNLPKADSSLTAKVDMIRKGLPTASVKRVAGYYEIPESKMAALVGASERSISRGLKEHKPLNPAWSDRLYRLARIGARALEVFESPVTARNWLKRPNRALGGAAPIEVLDTDAGTEQVDELLTRIEYGVYS
jgi:putative toxin-antitoxin system antitoxin component (TIGR02293 family)